MTKTLRDLIQGSILTDEQIQSLLDKVQESHRKAGVLFPGTKSDFGIVLQDHTTTCQAMKTAAQMLCGLVPKEVLDAPPDNKHFTLLMPLITSKIAVASYL